MQEAERYKEMLDQLHEENQDMNNHIQILTEKLQQNGNEGPSEDDYAEFKKIMEKKDYENNELQAQLE